MKRYRIPEQDVLVSEDEVAVTQTRIFQRLFNLKQLGLVYLVYPAATHTRGAHSIECLNEATKFLQKLGISEKDEDYWDVRMAALLHDIAHVPFSHTLEDEHLILGKHDRPDRLRRGLDALKEELAHQETAVSRIERATPILLSLACNDPENHPHDWRSDVVGNTVCADLLAYITTDSARTGISKRPGHYRIYEYLELAEKRLCIRLTKGGLRTDVVSAIMDLLDMRYALTERVLFHHAKCTASAMLARAARLAALQESDNLLRMGDERFLEFLDEQAQKLGTPEGEGACRLIDGLQSRRLYQRIFKVARGGRKVWDDSRHVGDFCDKWRNGQQVEEVLRSVEDVHELDRGSLVLWCPEGKAGMKLAEAHVVWESADKWEGPYMLRSNEVRAQFPGVGKRVQMIEEQYEDLWTFWIAMDRNLVEQHAAQVVTTLDEEIGIDCDTVFLQTYLHRNIDGFKEKYRRHKEVRRRTRKIEVDAERTLSGQAASDGYKQNPPADAAAIDLAIRSAIERGPVDPKTQAQFDFGESRSGSNPGTEAT